MSLDSGRGSLDAAMQFLRVIDLQVDDDLVVKDDCLIEGDLTVEGNVLEEIDEVLLGDFTMGTGSAAGGDITIYEDGSGNIALLLDTSAADLTLGDPDTELGLLKIYGKDGVVLQLGDATHEGGDIVVYMDASGNKALELDADAGQLRLPVSGIGGGIVIGGDVEIYRTDTNAAVMGASLLRTGSYKSFFRDQQIFISSQHDGHLDIDADVSIDLNALLVILTGDLELADEKAIQTGVADGDYVLFKADDTGVGVIEVARLQGAADPYFQATLPIVLLPIATASLPATPVEGMTTYDDTLKRLTYYDGGAWRTIPEREGDTFTGNIIMEKSTPSLYLTDTGEFAPLGKFGLVSNNDLFYIYGRNAANDAWEEILYLERAADGGVVNFKGTDGILLAGPIELVTTQKVQFRDATIYISSKDDGHLDLDADVSVDINAALVLGGGVTIGGNLDMANYDIFNVDEIIGEAAAMSLIIGSHVTSGAPVQRDIAIQTGDAATPQVRTTRMIFGSSAAQGSSLITSYEPMVIPSLKVSDLTSTRVVFAATNGELVDDADFTFSTDTLTVTKIAATEFTGNITMGGNDILGTADGWNIGGAANEVANLYIGTGKIYLYTDQQEYIYSAGTSIIFGIGGSNELYISTGSIYPATDEGLNIGGSLNRFTYGHFSDNLFLDSDDAEVGAQLKNSPPLTLRAAHWNAASEDYDATIFHDITTAGASPVSKLVFTVDGSELMRLTSVGRLEIPIGAGGILIGGDALIYRSAANKFTLGSGNTLSLQNTDKIEFRDAAIYISSKDDGHLDLEADVSIDLNADVTIGANTLDVSGGTLTLADNQISGDKVEGGTIAAIAITSLTGLTTFAASGDLDIGAHGFRAASLTADGINVARVIFAGANGLLSHDLDFTFSVDTLTVTKIATTTFTGTLHMGAADIDMNGRAILGAAEIKSEFDATDYLDWVADDQFDILIDSGVVASFQDDQIVFSKKLDMGAQILDISAGTLTLADNQISGDKVEGGTIAAITITALTVGTMVNPGFATDYLSWEADDQLDVVIDSGVIASFQDDTVTMAKILDLSSIGAGNPLLKLIATTDAAPANWGDAAGYEVDEVPAGWIEGLIGATPIYIPYWT